MVQAMYKRSLYKATSNPQGSAAAQKNRRKPLAQGRLVSDSHGVQSHAKTKGILAHGIETQTVSAQPLQSLSQQGSILSTSKTVEENTTSVPHGSITPRKSAPHTTEQNSPARVPKADSLDLSDSDDDDSWRLRPVLSEAKKNSDEVMVLDASLHLVDPNQSEVDVVVGYTKSPARVICHSPAAAKSQLRNSIKRGDNPKVAVDSAPSINITSATPAVKGKKDTSQGHQKILDSLPLFTQMEKLMGLPQPNFDDSGDSQISEQGLQEKSDVQSINSESDVCSVNDFVTKTKKADTGKPKTPTTAKKKVKVVPSRYMQAAKAKASMSVMIDKTIKCDRSKGSRSLELHQPEQHRTKKHNKKPLEPLQKQQKNPSTPDNSQVTKSGKTSTPTSDVSFFSTTQPDVSAISSVDASKIASKSHKKSKPKPKVTQEYLDLLYGRYCQWLFLNSKAKKVKEEQERKAMSQMLFMHEELEKLRKLNHEKKAELARLTHLNDLDEQLDIQRECLGPVINHLPKLTKQYETLAQALDTTRHQIPTKGIYIPQDEEHYHKQLEQTLQESEYLLGNLSALTGQPLQRATSTVSKYLSSLEKESKHQCRELKQCNEMLAATENLTVQECTLLIQKNLE